MTIPILAEHDQKRPIGTIDVQKDRLSFRLVQGVRRDDLFAIFGGAGLKITDQEFRDGEVFVIAGEILEFSLSASSAA